MEKYITSETTVPLSAGISLLDGTRFCYADPGAAEYPIEEIARGLAHVPRFGGHTKFFYPVAMHCVNGSYLLDNEADAFAFLMHDALEGLMGFDPPTPLKHHIPQIKTLENTVHPVLAKQFGFQYPYSDAVHRADVEMLILENEHLRGCKPLIGIDIDAYDITHVHALVAAGVINMGRVTPDMARELYLQRFEELKP